MKWLGIAVLAGFCVACGGNAATDTSAAETAGSPQPAGAAKRAVEEVTIPAGTTMRLRLTSAIGSDTSAVEDAVSAELREPISVDGRIVVPAGTPVSGTVVDVARSGRVKGRARIAYRFDVLRYQGERYDMRTASVAHEAEATKGEDASTIAIGAGAGAVVGGILGGGDGAAKGAAIGGAGGTGVVLATRGREVRLGPGAAVNARLAASLTVRVRS